MNPLVLDNVLDENVLDRFMETAVVPGQKWEFLPCTCDGPSETSIKGSIDKGGIALPILQTLHGYQLEHPNLYAMLSEAREAVEREAGVRIVKALRTQLNVTFPYQTEGAQLVPHADAQDPRSDPLFGRENKDLDFPLTALLFLKDGDGDFVLYNERVNPWMSGLPTLTEKLRVSPKKNRMVIFNSSHFHAGTHPSTNHRYVVNQIFTVNDK